MEEQQRRNRSYSSFYSDSSEELVESEAVDVISDRRGSAQSQKLFVPVIRERSVESATSSGIKQQESGGFSFKLELKEVSSP